MSEAIDLLTVNWEEEGELKVKEIKRHVLSKGAWCTLMFLYQEMDPKTKEYREPKISIRRYKKRADVYVYQSKFNISSAAQAHEISRMIQEWYPEKKES